MVSRYKITRSEKDFIIWSIGSGFGLGMVGLPLRKLLIENFGVTNLYFQMGIGLSVLIGMAYLLERK